ncbi:MAG: helix-turn-helix domain-containing protein [Chloroflexi bacterium]|nr:helix-turn-helix domain-containing protein [Chloroflexota bacterium]
MSESSEWVSLGEAADIIGVHPATIRNWAERGEFPFRRTPGGHRRFRRADLDEWLASNRVSNPTEAQVVVQSALGRTRMDISSQSKLSDLDWYQTLSPESRDAMRQEGLHIMDALIKHLSDPTWGSGLETAHDIGRIYGNLARQEGLSLSKALQGYLYFSDFPLDAVIQLSETNMPRATVNWGEMLRQINQFTRRILIGLIEAYDEE